MRKAAEHDGGRSGEEPASRAAPRHGRRYGSRATPVPWGAAWPRLNTHGRPRGVSPPVRQLKMSDSATWSTRQDDEPYLYLGAFDAVLIEAGVNAER